MNKFNALRPAFRGTSSTGFPLALMAALMFISSFASVALAGENYYGTVEEFGGGRIVVKTTKHSTGHWKIDAATRRSDSVAVGDWVFAEVGRAGFIRVLRVEERPTGHAGVIQSIHDHVLSVHSGPNIENWNIMETTIMNGAARSEVKAGDEIGVKLYRNHNLAELRVIRSGAR